ncbi:MAG TPA: hypothetical protein VNA28_17810 [Solirubrobacteraceae bacterium]|nr:hypothetical protein [Solirubrobacteraceae bacterium]
MAVAALGGAPPQLGARVAFVGDPDAVAGEPAELRGGGVERVAARAQDDHALAERGDVLGLMGGHEHDPFVAEVGYELAEAQPLLGIEPGAGLVEHEQLRVAEQRLRERDAAAHPTGEPADAAPGDVAEADQLQHAPHLAVARTGIGHLLEDRDVVDELEGGELAMKAGSWGM